MDNLLQLIEAEKERLQDIINSAPNEELEFFRTIFKQEGKNSLQDLKNVSGTDLVLALTRAKGTLTLSFQEIKDKITACGDIVEKLGLDERMHDFLEMLYKISLEDEDIYPCLIELLSKDHELGIKDMKNPAYKYAKKIIRYVKNCGCENYDIKTFLEFLIDINLIEDEKQAISETTSTCIAYAYVIKSYFENEYLYSDLNMKMAKIAKLDPVLKGLRENKKTIEGLYQDLRTYYETLNVKEQSIKKACQKELTTLIVLQENLPQLLASGEIKNAQELLKKITSEKIRLEILKLVYTHNLGIYSSIEEEYQRLSSSPANKYQSLLNKYGILKDSYLVASVMGNSLADVEEMLKMVTSLEITNPDTILKIVQRSNLTIMNTLSTQVTKGIISPSLLQEYPALFFGDSKEYRRFTTNLAYMRESGINPYYLGENQELFLLSNRSLRKNFQILEDYNLLPCMKVGISCSFLGHENLESGIDTLLGLGYEEFLEQNISLLNYQDNFKRLRILKELNIPVTSSEELEKVLTTDKFLVPDDCLEDYLYNASICRFPSTNLSSGEEEVSIASLDNFKATERTYNIGGVILSKNRVQRNLEAIREPINTLGILYATTKESVLSDEEFDTVVAVISPKEKNAVKAKIC